MNKKAVKSDVTLFGANPPVLTLWWWKTIIPPALLSIVTTIVYYPSLSFPFQFDDLANISKNFYLRFYDLSKAPFNNSRWIGELFNAIAFKIGRFDPFYYRIFSLGIHLLTGIILYFFILNLCSHLKEKNPSALSAKKTDGSQKRNFSFLSSNALPIAFTTSGLFLLHPVQTQTVSYVIQARLEGLATLFILATLFLFVKAVRAQTTLTKSMFFGFMFVTGFLACGTKEIVVITPFLAILIDWLFLAQESWVEFKKRFFIYCGLAIVMIGTVLYFLDIEFIKQIFTFSATTNNNRGNVLTDHAFQPITAWPFFISQFKVVLHYLFMFLWPINICVEYDWKLSKGFFALDAFFPFIILASILFFAVYLLFKKKHPYASFGLIWFFLAVAPRSSFIPSSELICDYKTYLASIGWLFIIAVGFVKLSHVLLPHIKTFFSSCATRDRQMFATVLCCSLLGYSSYTRNKVWESPASFWRDITLKAPKKARGHNNLGVALAETGKVDEAIQCYQRAIKLDAYYTDPYNNLAVGYTHKGNIDKAILALNQAIALFPHYPEAHNNRGSLYLKKKNYEMAERDLKHAIKLRSHYGKAHYNLGRLYYSQNQSEKAWESFKNATQGDLDTVEGFHTLGQLSLRLKKHKYAVDSFEKMLVSLQRRPHTPDNIEKETSGYFNLANAYFMNKQHKKASALYQTLMRRKPFDARFVHNWGETLFTQGQIQKALTVFKRASSLPTTLPQTHLRIASCLEKLKRVDDAKNYLESLLEVKASDQFKQMVKAEMARINLQDQLDRGRGKIKMNEIFKTMQDLGTTITGTVQT